MPDNNPTWVFPLGGRAFRIPRTAERIFSLDPAQGPLIYANVLNFLPLWMPMKQLWEWDGPYGRRRFRYPMWRTPRFASDVEATEDYACGIIRSDN